MARIAMEEEMLGNVWIVPVRVYDRRFDER